MEMLFEYFVTSRAAALEPTSATQITDQDINPAKSDSSLHKIWLIPLPAVDEWTEGMSRTDAG
jgi:hypothetical protein